MKQLSLCIGMGGPAPESLVFQCRHLGKRYRDQWVLRDINLQMPAGASLAVVGLNGAGKTTLLKLLLNLNRPSAGEVLLSGQPADTTQARRHVTYLPERFVPPAHLTVCDFLTLMMGLHQRPFDEQKACDQLTSLGMSSDALAMPVRSLSKGMTQKIGLTAALMLENQLTILDEPLSGLDPVARQTLAMSLDRLRAQGRSILFTTHSLAGLQSYCDRIAVLHFGECLFFGSPTALCDRFGADNVEQAFLTAIEAQARSFT